MDSEDKVIEAVPAGTKVIPIGSSGLKLTEQRYTLQVRPPLDRLSKAKLGDVQEIVASQLELMTVYHNVVLDQARESFRWALIAAGVGLLFFVSAVGFILYRQPQNAAFISLISGGLIEVISAINFYLYGKTSAQLVNFQSRLDTTQRFLLANSICESLEGESKEKARSELVRKIARIESSLDDNALQDLPNA